MGGELCGYILVGPEDLDLGNIAKAKEEVARIKILARTSVANSDRLTKKETKELDDLLELFNTGDVKDLLEEYLEAFEVQTFVDAYNNDYRYAMSRSWKFEDTQKRIFVCGEVTWGDGPTPNSAWWITQIANHLGLFEILGLE